MPRAVGKGKGRGDSGNHGATRIPLLVADPAVKARDPALKVYDPALKARDHASSKRDPWLRDHWA